LIYVWNWILSVDCGFCFLSWMSLNLRNTVDVTSSFYGANGLGNEIDPDATVFGLLSGLTDPFYL
jgi:hypothetical protein